MENNLSEKLLEITVNLFQSPLVEELFKSYKIDLNSLADLTVSIGNSPADLSSDAASYFPSEKKIIVNQDFLSKSTDKAIEEVLYHEIVHFVRDYKGLEYNGDNKNTFEDPDELAAIFEDLKLKEKDGLDLLQYLKTRYSSESEKTLKNVLEKYITTKLPKKAEWWLEHRNAGVILQDGSIHKLKPHQEHWEVEEQLNIERHNHIEFTSGWNTREMIFYVWKTDYSEAEWNAFEDLVLKNKDKMILIDGNVHKQFTYPEFRNSGESLKEFIFGTKVIAKKAQFTVLSAPLLVALDLSNKYRTLGTPMYLTMFLDNSVEFVKRAKFVFGQLPGNIYAQDKNAIRQMNEILDTYLTSTTVIPGASQLTLFELLVDRIYKLISSRPYINLKLGLLKESIDSTRILLKQAGLKKHSLLYRGDQGKAGWILPDGKFISVSRSEKEHVDYVLAYPAKFNLKKSDELYKQVQASDKYWVGIGIFLDNGWVRVAGIDPSEDMLLLQARDLTSAKVAEDYIYSQLSEVSEILIETEGEDTHVVTVEDFKIHGFESFRKSLINAELKTANKLYHATYKPLLKTIKEHGLKAPSFWSQDYYQAESFAEVPVDTEGNNKDIPDEWLDQIIVFEIDSSKLDKTSLEIDPNLSTDDEDIKTFVYNKLIPFSDLKMIKTAGLPPTSINPNSDSSPAWLFPQDMPTNKNPEQFSKVQNPDQDLSTANRPVEYNTPSLRNRSQPYSNLFDVLENLEKHASSERFTLGIYSFDESLYSKWLTLSFRSFHQWEGTKNTKWNKELEKKLSSMHDELISDAIKYNKLANTQENRDDLRQITENAREEEWEMEKNASKTRPSSMGQAWWVTRAGEWLDVSSDMGEGTNDHVGFLASVEDPVLAQKLGLNANDINALKELYETGEGTPEAGEVGNKVFENNIKVMHVNDTVYVVSKSYNRDVVERLFIKIEELKPKEIVWESFEQQQAKEFTLEQFLEFDGTNKTARIDPMLEAYPEISTNPIGEDGTKFDYPRGITSLKPKLNESDGLADILESLKEDETDGNSR